MRKDLLDLGFVFEYQRLDAQKFLVRQRRNRIWGTADVVGPNASEYGERMAQTVQSMQSDCLFPWEDCFDTSLPAETSEELPERARRQLETALADATLLDGSSNVFLDISKSDSHLEQATSVATCVRPTHAIYSHALGRRLTVLELFKCQGLWRDDFLCPEAVDQMLKEPKQAQDLAGDGLKNFSNMFLYCLHLATCCPRKMPR